MGGEKGENAIKNIKGGQRDNEIHCSRFFPCFLESHSGTEDANNFFSDLLPFIQRMALKLPSLFPYVCSVYYLIAKQEDEVSRQEKQGVRNSPPMRKDSKKEISGSSI
jgi:hypothetical protein